MVTPEAMGFVVHAILFAVDYDCQVRMLQLAAALPLLPLPMKAVAA